MFGASFLCQVFLSFQLLPAVLKPYVVSLAHVTGAKLAGQCCGQSNGKKLFESHRSHRSFRGLEIQILPFLWGLVLVPFFGSRVGRFIW